MTFLDVFSGIGGFRLGLERSGHECVGHVEIDKFANISYNAIHRPSEEEFFHDDITTLSDESIRGLRSRGIDILCGGFPCQAFSIAGARRGFEDTRGTLFFDIARMARILRPKYLFLENVKGLLNHNNGDTFETILRALDELGYDAEWSCLNSKDFGVPQNRERVFIIGHLRGERTRKVFPITSSDGENYRIQEQAVNTITTRTGEGKGSGSYVIESEQHAQGVMQVGNLIDTDSFGGNPQRGRVYGTEQDRHGVMVKEATKQGYAIAEPGDSINLEQPNSKTRRGRVGKGIANTLTTLCNQAVVEQFRIRKLTPKECWRLQGFPDWAFERAKAAGVSDSQLYKQAGNSVTASVIEAIGRKL